MGLEASGRIHDVAESGEVFHVAMPDIADEGYSVVESEFERHPWPITAAEANHAQKVIGGVHHLSHVILTCEAGHPEGSSPTSLSITASCAARTFVAAA